MSYEIVRTVKVATDGTVTVKSHSSNVWPRTDETWTMTYRNPANPFTGKLAGEVEVFAGFEQGNFHGAVARYQRQLEVLHHMPEYADFDWRVGGDKYHENSKRRDEHKREYYELLERALKTPAPKPRFAITKPSPYTLGGRVYLRKRANAYSATWQYSAAKGTLYRYRDQAEAVISNFHNTATWEVVEI